MVNLYKNNTDLLRRNKNEKIKKLLMDCGHARPRQLKTLYSLGRTQLWTLDIEYTMLRKLWTLDFNLKIVNPRA